jgi:16S rRNA (uracil1498-N3)-methyltransferase
MNYFFCENLIGDSGALSTEEAAHCFKVLRKKEGDTIYILDGNGGEYSCEIELISKRELSFKVINKSVHERSSVNIHIAVAPTKNISRIEWLLEKATEVGVSEFTFLECEHSERKVIKEERLAKIVQGATKQSGNFYLPKMNGLVKFSEFITDLNIDRTFIGYCEGERKTLLSQLNQSDEDILLIIGPEGDFSNSEVELALSKGVSPISLGNTRLRTETAALVGLVQIKSIIDA